MLKELWKNLKYAWKYVKEQKGKLIWILLLNIVMIVFSVVLPLLGSEVIVSLTKNEWMRLLILAILLLVCNTIPRICHTFFRKISIRMSNSILVKLRVDLGKNVLKLENESLDTNGSGVFIERLNGDAWKISDSFQSLIFQFSEVVTHVGYLLAIFITNKFLALYTCITLSILYFIEKKRLNRRDEMYKEVRKLNEKVTGILGELVRGARDIKMLNSEDDFLLELDKRIKNTNEKHCKLQEVNLFYVQIRSFLGDFFIALLLVFLAFFLKEGILIPTTALVLYNYYGRMRNSTNVVSIFMQYIKDFNLSCERVFAILKNEEFKKESFGTKHLGKVNGDFAFEDVTFSYGDRLVLNHLNFQIHANETVAFVGKSGAGKTTIFNLLCKMYNVNSGKILIDGNDIQELDKDSIRGNITIISQDPYIFNMTIRENLKLVKSDLTEEEMKESCKLACLDDFIESLPEKYDTMIGEGGINLSGGQKQRLAIARALIQKTEIILFDEATGLA